MSTTTTEIIDGTVYEVVTDPDGTVIRTPVGPASGFELFTDALTAALVDENLSAKDAMQAALDAVQES